MLLLHLLLRESAAVSRMASITPVNATGSPSAVCRAGPGIFTARTLADTSAAPMTSSQGTGRAGPAWPRS